MFDDRLSFVSRAFLRGEFDLEFKVYTQSGADEALLARLRAWDGRSKSLSETQLEGGFIQAFFVETWGCGLAGGGADHSLVPQMPVPGEGVADLGIGWFRGGAAASDAQVLCEFKDIRSKLDVKQNRKGRNFTPVEQCLSYLRGARRGLFGNEPVQPWWGLVTDMNEFRLYWWDRAPSEYLRFVIRGPRDLFAQYDLLSDGEDARFDRFLFSKLLQRDYLLSQAGRPPLLRLIERQWVKEEKLEGEFYEHYKAIRERLFGVLRINNQSFVGSPADLLRLTQKLLDRFIFAFYCEDMGERMLFPPQMLRDHMKGRSFEPFYDASGGEFWEFFKRLFRHMDAGGLFGQLQVPHINGGLFAPDPQIEALSIPNHIFATAGQGRNEASLESDTNTLLYLSARYNFAARGDAKHSISLYTLGRIFEQSITELEYRVGELEGRDSIAKLSKRKRDGVYYTPEWVVNYLVEQTLGPWFAAARAASGYSSEAEGAPGAEAASAYIERLRAMRIVDPACGSGAFLIAAFRRLVQERVAAERDRQGVAEAEINEAALVADILANNIYGVDINPAAVEIAKLALWLHSARADAPLSMLDRTIRCGNSLVAHDIWLGRQADAATRERVSSFDWREAFPEVWPDGAEGGFDIVLGNPPYVKLQNMTRVYPEMVAYVQASRGDDTYLSATGNFDLYLVFIEKGLRLLGPGGRMAYIAQSLWTVNEYGAGLRSLVRRSCQLERWIDFKSFQVFDEATTYTALQFFTHAPQEAVKVALAPDGKAANVDWARGDLVTPYAALPEHSEWLMATGPERALIERLARDCLRLDDASLTEGITVGIQTSADKIYHLQRLGTDRYRCAPKDGDAYEVRIEDSIMKPLVSGAEAKRYEEPATETYLLFPYERDARGVMGLIADDDMERRFPDAWAYLRSYEEELRERENRKMDGPEWWAYNYPKNLDKQDQPKLVVPRLVEHLKCCFDDGGRVCLDNVDVGGVLPSDEGSSEFLLGVLNGPVTDFVFRAISKPFRGDYRSANKQFIAPLPIPDANPDDRADVAAKARSLQQRWTQRRDVMRAAEERLSVLARSKHPARWLWPELPTLDAKIADAPKTLSNRSERRAWADAQLDEMEAQACEKLQAALNRGGRLDARYEGGELKLYVAGAVALGRIYLDEAAGRITEAYWRWLLIAHPPREAGRFAADLRRPPADVAGPAGAQFVERVAALAGEIAAIEAEERAMNEKLYELYALTPGERLLVERDAARSRR
ncbi:MAG: DNA methyltransferase [Terricaulis sp.]